MITRAEGVSWGNTTWNLLRFVSNVASSVARLADDFKLDVSNSNRRAIERESFGSSVEAGLEKLFSGVMPELEDEDDFVDVEEEEDYG